MFDWPMTMSPKLLSNHDPRQFGGNTHEEPTTKTADVNQIDAALGTIHHSMMSADTHAEQTNQKAVDNARRSMSRKNVRLSGAFLAVCGCHACALKIALRTVRVRGLLL